MAGLAATAPDEDDTAGARAVRAAAQELTEAARHVRSLTGAESSTLLIGLQRRLTDLAVAAEELADRELSAACIREAHRREDYAAGWDACLEFRRGLRSAG